LPRDDKPRDDDSPRTDKVRGASQGRRAAHADHRNAPDQNVNLTGKVETRATSGRTAVVHPDFRSGAKAEAQAARDPQSRLEEAIGLALAIALDVVHAEVVPLRQPRPNTLLGSGAVDRIKEIVEAEEVQVVVVDATLTPVQQRNLELAWCCKVIDRTGLILEIFGARARTREGRLQVELASLNYQRSRLVRSWTHLERQRGGFGFLGGPGETQIEADRRLIDERIGKLKRELEDVRRTRSLHRKARERVPYPVIALVGYTNAGKSTLFNRLTHSDVLAKDLLFATLDPTMRAIKLPSGRRVIMSDTVGFISDLPTDLVAAFRATLEEVLAADVILHVRDVAHEDSEAQRLDVLNVLSQLGVDAESESRVVEVLNKLDRLDEGTHQRLLSVTARDPDVVALSALTGEGCDALLALLDERAAVGREVRELALPAGDGAAIAWLYDHADVLGRQDGDDGMVRLTVGMDADTAARFERRKAS
jgi:GTP-binding protein HflX